MKKMKIWNTYIEKFTLFEKLNTGSRKNRTAQATHLKKVFVPLNWAAVAFSLLHHLIYDIRKISEFGKAMQICEPLSHS